jgi:hypothetical protein
MVISGEWYIETCYNCGVQFGMRREHQAQLLRSKASFYCPNGHSQKYTENTEDRLRRELERAKQREAMLIDERQQAQDETKRVTANWKRTKTKLKNTTKRATAGVCLECHRTFANVGQHMRSCHGHSPKPKQVLPLP